MEELWINSPLAAAGTAFWLGLLTSMSPCPLASNIAAISYVAKGSANPRLVLAAGALYTLGRVLAYVVLGFILAASLASAVNVSNLLQRYMNLLLGPVLVLSGMFLLEWLNWPSIGGGIGEGLTRRVDRWGLWGATALGALFALSFCPVSAALFFGSLLPLAVGGGALLMPSLYGVGTGVPVLGFSFLAAFSARMLSETFGRITWMEFWARRVTGIVFIVVGVYYTLNYIFEAFA